MIYTIRTLHFFSKIHPNTRILLILKSMVPIISPFWMWDLRMWDCFISSFWFLYLEKICFEKYFFLYQLKISSRIQKSYLEHRAIILKMRKIQNPSLHSLFVRSWWYYVHCYVALPLTFCRGPPRGVAASVKVLFETSSNDNCADHGGTVQCILFTSR